MTAERFTVKRTWQGGVVVLLDGHRMTNADRETNPDWWNDEALYWVGFNDRSVDTCLLAAQYLYAGETETWFDVRPHCTRGTVGTGYCTSETVTGALYCGAHNV